MNSRHEFQLGELTVSYQIAKWHPNDGPCYDPFPEEIWVSSVDHYRMDHALKTAKAVWAVFEEECREDMGQYL